MADTKTKPFWQSKTVWANVVMVIIATITAIDAQFGTGLMLSPITQAILAVLGIFGIYGRISATTTLK
ncbi:MAG: hypothetical protein KKC77_19565 [Proteobacteria bacterium]|nr:hypothetical protein [Pseudomonadota bacterium]